MKTSASPAEQVRADSMAALEREERRERSWFVALLQHQPTRELLSRICRNRLAKDMCVWPAYDSRDYYAIGKRELAREYIDKIVKYGTADDIAELVYGKEKACQ